MSELTETEQSQNELADINTISTSFEGLALNSDAALIAELFRRLKIERKAREEVQGIGLLPTLGLPPLGYLSGGSSSSKPSYHDTSSSKHKEMILFYDAVALLPY